MNQSPKTKGFEIVIILVLLFIWMVNVVFVLLTKARDVQSLELTMTLSGHIPDKAVCIPCAAERRENNGTATSPRASQAVVSIDGVQMCCDDQHDDLVHLLHVLMAWNSIVETPTVASTVKGVNIRPSAQLFMDQKQFEGKAIHWSVEPGFNAGHVEGGLRFINNSILVQDDGLYYLHSSLNLFTRHTNDDVTGNAVIHSIIRSKINEQTDSKVLLSKTSTLPYKEGRFVTSVLEEFINVSSGDILKVTLSNYSYIYNHSASNTFGIFKLR